MHNTRQAAVILAGGHSRRLGGGDKCLLELGGGVILDQVIARLSPQAAPLALNANGDPARFARFGLPVLADLAPGQPGPLAGVHAAMTWAAAQGAETVLTVAADTPFFPARLVEQLRRAAGPASIALAVTPGPTGALEWHPTFGLWPVTLRAQLEEALRRGQRKMLEFAQEHGARPALFDAEQDPFFNINTAADLVLAQRRAAQP
jgi:molybdopterin-guanine dinucleotide biosynthesis protein A